ncbi:hypothetical protein CW304_02905 [Bacillus sp. UFRGS-B20]|nr:hypothetical protein CW304_02905 [Bacillus sp. UFRGS-B20]
MIAQHGGTFSMADDCLSNIAQGSAALAMFWISKKNQNDKYGINISLHIPSAITEPADCMVLNLRNKFPLLWQRVIGSLLEAIIH